MYEVSWDEYIKDVKTLSGLIKKEYQCLLAVARGGTIVGTMLSHILKMPMAVIISESYEEQKQKEVKLSEVILPPSVKDKSIKDVLIVDDLLDTGRSHVAIKERYKDWSFDTAVLYHKEKCSRPTYWVKKIVGWIEFPYEKNA